MSTQPERCPCVNCGHDHLEHSREALTTPNDHGWRWNVSACPIGDGPFHPTQVFAGHTQPQPSGEPILKCGHTVSEHERDWKAAQASGTPEQSCPLCKSTFLGGCPHDWHKQQQTSEPSAPVPQPYCSCEAGSDGDCDVHGPMAQPSVGPPARWCCEGNGKGEH